MMCGRRATFTMKEGSFFSEKEIYDALKSQRLGLASFTKEERSRAICAYELGTKPVT